MKSSYPATRTPGAPVSPTGAGCDECEEAQCTLTTTLFAVSEFVLLMGDDLNDFAKVFEDSQTVDSRIAATEQFKEQFGKRFIMLPNAMYGYRESAIDGK